MRVTAGPAGLASLLLYEIMQLYAEITALNEEQQRNQVEAQYSSAKAQADATTAAGKAAGDGAIAAGVAGVVGAGMSLGFSIGGQVMASRGVSAESEELNGEINPVKSVDHAVANVRPVNVAGGVDEPIQPDSLAAQLRDGNFRAVEGRDPTEVQDAVNALKASGDEEFNFDDWRTELRQRRNSLETARNTISMKMSTTKQVYDTLGQGLGGITNGAGGAFKGTKDKEQGLEQARSQLSATSQQQAGQAAQTMAQNQEKSAQAELQVNQVMEAMVRAGTTA